jgi:hypothetical protein
MTAATFILIFLAFCALGVGGAGWGKSTQTWPEKQ